MKKRQKYVWKIEIILGTPSFLTAPAMMKI